MRTYYIVEHEEVDGKVWRVYRRSLLTALGHFSVMNSIIGCLSMESADACQNNLVKWANGRKIKPRIVRTINM